MQKRERANDRLINPNITIKESQFNKLLELKNEGKVDSVSSKVREILDEYFLGEGKRLSKDLCIVVIYPIIISILLFVWGLNTVIVIGAGDFSFNLLYTLNLVVASLAMAGAYYLIDKNRKRK